MTERFDFVCDDENCYFKQDDKKIDCYEIVDILNKLTKENEELKKSGNTKDFCADVCADFVNEVVEEYKELKTQNNAYLQDIEVYREENTHLKLYKNAVHDVLLSWSQKSLTAKQLEVVIGIMEELNIEVKE